ncbi:Polygalacturonase [Evansella caseinilytica]|uniref:Polygalacturonase n=1 Tax=Evansella caseinilytica TaxID=1503961 RepID=A0A1H3NXA9_9BACI|nr:glycoside hydrolase family 28 protein [Evansella caseinilytica]SDY93343.1 Polygalacturonase [Evansella caseinilytica]
MPATHANKRLPEFKVKLPEIPERQFYITDFGAVGDGTEINTAAIEKAIAACAAAGGGKVIIPPGIWLTGPIRLTSRLNLHAEAGATVVFTGNCHAYPLITSCFEGEQMIRCQSPLDGENLEHVAITGDGVFDGSGEYWRPVKRFKLTVSQWKKLVASGGTVDKEKEIWWPSENAMNGAEVYQNLRKNGAARPEDFQSVKEYLRPNLLSLRKSKYILFDGPTFQNSPAWNLHPWLCEHITIRRISVRNPWFAQNGDGLDIESCRYVTVEKSVFDVGDDAICIKSGKNEAGRRLGVAAEDILIRDCKVYSGHGGFVIGSEMSGGVRNIQVSDCDFYGTDTGLRFKSTRGRGGIVENIDIRRIRMHNISKEAIVFHMYYEIPEATIENTPVPVTKETPVFRDIAISNVSCTAAGTALLMKGLPEMPLKGVTFDKLTLTAKKGVICSQCKIMQFTKTRIFVKEGPAFTFQDCINTSVSHI